MRAATPPQQGGPPEPWYRSGAHLTPAAQRPRVTTLHPIVTVAEYCCCVAGSDQATAGRPRFPALDPEPPPRPWWQRLAVPAAVLVVAGAVVAAVQFWPFSRGAPSRAEATDLGGGRVVAVTPAGGVVLSDPGGGHVTQVRGLGNAGDMVAVSPDDRYLSLFNGQVVIVRHGPALAAYPAKVPLSSETTTAWPDAFADHGRALIMLQDYGTVTGSSSPASVVSLATGHPVPLGTGEHVAGDPQAPGAFVSVPAPSRPSATSAQLSPDSRIELRGARRPPAVLATAATLNRALGRPPGAAASLASFPSPSGSEVAVTVRPAAGGAAGVVVMSRAGRVLATIRAPLGAQSVPVWSPSGKSLAYLGTGAGGGAQLNIWSAGGPAVPSKLPYVAGVYSACVWSPGGTAVLCSDAEGSRWAVTRARDGHTVAVRGTGLPVAWPP